MTNARVRRGRITQQAAASYARLKGFPDARAVEAFLPGRDLLGMHGLAGECKATSQTNILAALKQADKSANGDVPWSLYRPPGYGVERVGLWVASLYYADFLELAVKAGYPLPTEGDK